MLPESIQLIEMFGIGCVYGGLASVGPAVVGLAWTAIKSLFKAF